MRIHDLLLLSTCVIAAAGCSSTDPVRPDPAQATEHVAGSEAAWAHLDTDSDGFLTIEELETARAVALLRDLDNADTNRDERVSREEWNAWWPRMTRTASSPTLQALSQSAAAPAAPPDAQ